MQEGSGEIAELYERLVNCLASDMSGVPVEPEIPVYGPEFSWPATVEQIEEAEQQLGFQLPEDYRALLLVAANQEFLPGGGNPPVALFRLAEEFRSEIIFERQEMGNDNSLTLLGDLERLVVLGGGIEGYLYASTGARWRLLRYNCTENNFVTPLFPSLTHWLRSQLELSEVGLLRLNGASPVQTWSPTGPTPRQAIEIYERNGYEGRPKR